MTQLVRGYGAQHAAGVNVSQHALNSIEENIAVSSPAILSQECHAKDRIPPRISARDDVQHELIRSWHTPAFICLSAVHPLNRDTGSQEQSCRLTLSLPQQGRLHTGGIIHQYRDLHILLRDRATTP